MNRTVVPTMVKRLKQYNHKQGVYVSLTLTEVELKVRSVFLFSSFAFSFFPFNTKTDLGTLPDEMFLK